MSWRRSRRADAAEDGATVIDDGDPGEFTVIITGEDEQDDFVQRDRDPGVPPSEDAEGEDYEAYAPEPALPSWATWAAVFVAVLATAEGALLWVQTNRVAQLEDQVVVAEAATEAAEQNRVEELEQQRTSFEQSLGEERASVADLGLRVEELQEGSRLQRVESQQLQDANQDLRLDLVRAQDEVASLRELETELQQTRNQRTSLEGRVAELERLNERFTQQSSPDFLRARGIDSLLGLIEADRGHDARRRLAELQEQGAFEQGALDGGGLVQTLVACADELQTHRESLADGAVHDAGALQRAGDLRLQARELSQRFTAESATWIDLSLDGEIAPRRAERVAATLADLEESIDADLARNQSRLDEGRARLAALQPGQDPAPAFEFADSFGSEELAELARAYADWAMARVVGQGAFDVDALALLEQLDAWHDRARSDGWLAATAAGEDILWLGRAERWYVDGGQRTEHAAELEPAPEGATPGQPVDDWRARLLLQQALADLENGRRFPFPDGRVQVYRSTDLQGGEVTWLVERDQPILDDSSSSGERSWSIQRTTYDASGERTERTMIPVAFRNFTYQVGNRPVLDLLDAGDGVRVAYWSPAAGDAPPQSAELPSAMDLAAYRSELGPDSIPCLVVDVSGVVHWVSPQHGLVRWEVPGAFAVELVHAGR